MVSKASTEEKRTGGSNSVRLTNPIPINRHAFYDKPVMAVYAATHVGVRNGLFAFFESESGEEFYRSKSKWRFWRIPEGMTTCRFPDFKRTKGGYVYGKPEFFKSEEEAWAAQEAKSKAK